MNPAVSEYILLKIPYILEDIVGTFNTAAGGIALTT